MELRMRGKKALDRCRIKGCEKLAMGCEPIRFRDGTSMRVLQRNFEERYCEVHHPKMKEKRVEQWRQKIADKQLCPSIHKKKAPVCLVPKIKNPCSALAAGCSEGVFSPGVARPRRLKKCMNRRTWR